MKSWPTFSGTVIRATVEAIQPSRASGLVGGGPDWALAMAGAMPAALTAAVAAAATTVRRDTLDLDMTPPCGCERFTRLVLIAELTYMCRSVQGFGLGSSVNGRGGCGQRRRRDPTGRARQISWRGVLCPDRPGSGQPTRVAWRPGDPLVP